MENQWIPVTERLPEEWVTVLVNTKFGFIATAYIDITGKWRIAETREFMERRDITHWMPLPEPPKDGR